MSRAACLGPESLKVLANRAVAPNHFVLEFESPRIAAAARPGQFVQILCSDSNDPLLPRPFSFLGTSKRSVSLLYHVVGKGTKLLSLLRAGERVRVTGPLGNGFSIPKKGTTVALVGGGVGIPPLAHLAAELRTLSGARKSTLRTGSGKPEVHAFLGARTKDYLLCRAEFKAAGALVHEATDDGSKGKKGFVTEILLEFLKKEKKKPVIYACGPTPMLKAVSAIAVRERIECEVAVEEPMACGFGACLGCAIEVVNGEGSTSTKHRFAMACVEGPVFRAADIVWQ